MSKQRRDSLARSGWFPIKTYNRAIYELEIEGVIEIRKRMVEWKKGLYYRLTPAGLARQKDRFPRVMQLVAAFDGLPTDDALLLALRGAYADHLHETWIKPLGMADRLAIKPWGAPRRKLKL
jgi:DNA-binding PadR family transcriptional regulator